MSDNGEPRINWQVVDLNKEWKHFRQHSDFTFKRPLAGKTQIEKVNYLLTFKSDKGREYYEIFTWAPGNDDNPAGNEDYAKYEAYVALKRNQIRATVTFNHRK